METREARRAAEKAAKERLGGPLIAAVGELGVAVARQQASVAAVAAAREQGRALVLAAQQEADRLAAEARVGIAEADEEYRAAHDAALRAGWFSAALVEMGYDGPPPRRRSRVTPTPDDGAPEVSTYNPDDGTEVDEDHALEPAVAEEPSRPQAALTP